MPKLKSRQYRIRTLGGGVTTLEFREEGGRVFEVTVPTGDLPEMAERFRQAATAEGVSVLAARNYTRPPDAPEGRPSARTDPEAGLDPKSPSYSVGTTADFSFVWIRHFLPSGRSDKVHTFEIALDSDEVDAYVTALSTARAVVNRMKGAMRQ